ncbi:MAG: lysine--tRNA ligase [Candidatus Aenigmarchaeota archaeon]|nr:lysine--tRNA ligase [Candidatus Aenigmarchaeota archaeon]
MNNLFWVDQTAKEVAERFGGRTKKLRTEMGLGASGIPHVGSLGDGVRSYVVSIALKGLGEKSEFIAFSDDRDGLRKIPAGMPDSLEKDVGKPVSMIDDPFGCHKSYAYHISSLLIRAFRMVDVKFRLKRANEEYAKGTLDKEITEILSKWQQAGEIIKRVTGQDKYLTQLPFLPICKNCGRIYTTRAYKFVDGKILYKCDLEFVGKNSSTGKEIVIKGCGIESEAGIRDGKLVWKVEFAARWRALKINYEAYGKDILDSVRCNDAICKEILNYEPPLHSFYEMFTERNGKKISKSAGNIFTPERWLRYASPASLRLLFLKRLGTSRVVDPDAIPAYMDEVDELARVYSGKVKVGNEKELEHMKRLHEYVNFLKPKEPTAMVQYGMLTTLFRIAKNKKIIVDMLKRTGHMPKEVGKNDETEIKKRIKYAENWVRDTIPEEKIEYALSESQKRSLVQLAAELKSKTFTEEELSSRLFEIAKENNLQPREFFEAAYVVLLNNRLGPRLAQFIIALGQKKVAKMLDRLTAGS